MEVLDRSGREEASAGKLKAQAPTPIGCGDWDAVHFEPRSKREKTQKGPAGNNNEDSVTVAQDGRKEKGANRSHTACQPSEADPGEAGGPELQASRRI